MVTLSVLAAAVPLDDGDTGLTVQAVATGAGVPRSTTYRWWPDNRRTVPQGARAPGGLDRVPDSLYTGYGAGMTLVVDRRPVGRWPAPALLLLSTVVWSLVAGVATSFAQGWLPPQAGSLANSAAPWCAVAFLSALVAARASAAVTAGPLALAALVAGYYVTSDLRGQPVGLRTVAFWGLVAVVAGPVLGLAAYAVRHRRGLVAAAACGVPVGLLVGEGAYGLAVIADTTYPPYWWAEVVSGVVLLAVLGAVRLRRPGALAAAVVAAAGMATVVFTLLDTDLLGVL